MFSPYYAAARRAGRGDPQEHVCINAILYTPGAKCWAMTERGRPALDRSATHIAVGPSRMAWDGSTMVIDVDEWTVPLPRRLKGRIVVDAGAVFAAGHDLDSRSRHQWRPFAPFGRASVRFERPGLAWQGSAYVDMNSGVEPLEAGFRGWTWSREHIQGATRILYDVEQRDGARRGLALEYRPDGIMAHVEPPPVQPLSRTGWRVSRATRAAPDRPACVVRDLEDTPFYSRSLLGIGDPGGARTAVHESVDLDRFASRWVQMLLPFKMPRRRG